MEMNSASEKERKQILLDSVSGCLFGGAIGDALGYPVEFLNYRQIVDEYGESGIVEFDTRRSGKAEVSDDTQMTLFTATGLLYYQTRGRLRGIAGPISGYVFKAYQEWYKTQVEPHFYYYDQFHTSWLHNIELFHSSRAPGNTCLSAIATSNGTGSVDNPVNNSKGCGGVMRVAPVGCFAAAGHLGDERISAKEAAEIAALTHGHPLGYIPAAFMSCMIHKIIDNKMRSEQKSLYDIASETLDVVKELYSEKQYYDEFESIVRRAVILSNQDVKDIEAVSQLGQGWVAEETLAIALYSVLKYQDSFKNAMICAVNHDGDSDSTGAVAGNILGAYLGLAKMGCARIITELEAYDVIFELAQDLVEGCQMSEYGKYQDVKWLSKYVHCDYGR